MVFKTMRTIENPEVSELTIKMSSYQQAEIEHAKQWVLSRLKDVQIVLTPSSVENGCVKQDGIILVVLTTSQNQEQVYKTTKEYNRQSQYVFLSTADYDYASDMYKGGFLL